MPIYVCDRGLCGYKFNGPAGGGKKVCPQCQEAFAFVVRTKRQRTRYCLTCDFPLEGSVKGTHYCTNCLVWEDDWCEADEFLAEEAVDETDDLITTLENCREAD